MNHKNQLKFCTKCLKREVHLSKEVICSLTHEKPEFYLDCPNFEFDVTTNKDLSINETERTKNSLKKLVSIFSIIITISLIILEGLGVFNGINITNFKFILFFIGGFSLIFSIYSSLL